MTWANSAGQGVKQRYLKDNPFVLSREFGKPRSIEKMSRALILIGLILIAAGLLWPWIDGLKLGRLPGDLIFQRGSFTFYFPITTGLLVSAILTLVLWLANR